ncbi:hypothetical protein [Embleya hyalina]|uniref:hypothetical protein n=1 Tax=Embleya hyalina TaxID=516124 RepID=UPI000F848FAB|nr:hypothetical protein [Embleya hyalina]
MARPCTARAASSHGTPSATANSAIATASAASAAIGTGRRPTWSDSAPTTIGAIGSAGAQSAKTTARVVAEKRHRD